jgi:hypothetical protein
MVCASPSRVVLVGEGGVVVRVGVGGEIGARKGVGGLATVGADVVAFLLVPVALVVGVVSV